MQRHPLTRAARLLPVLLLAAPATLRAHEAGARSGAALDPGVLLALVITGMAYAWGVRSLWRAAGRDRGIRVGQAVSFAAGWMLLALALLPPLDPMADRLFAAHMMQHLVLMTLAPPLLLLGKPVLAVTWLLPRVTRRASRWVERWPAPVRRIRLLLLAPLAVLVLHNAAIWIWHLPALYDAALTSDPVHALEHLSFFGTALLLWWVALAPGAGRRTRLATGLLLVFGTALSTGILGAVLTFAPRVWYPAQGQGAQVWHLSPLEDQQLAGLIMWVPGGLLYVVAAAGLFIAWLEHPDNRGRRVPAALVTLLGLVVLLAGCAGDRGTPNPVPGGDPERGATALATLGCAGCHTINGIRGADANVGPPLTRMGRRTMIAGRVPNTVENMIQWIRSPQSIEPGTAMPDLGVTDQTARDIAAYLYTLR